MEDRFQKIANLFGEDFVPEAVEDTPNIDFDKPIRGKYICRIMGLERKTGSSSKCEGGIYDFYALKLKVEQDVEGEHSNGRYLDKTYSNTVGKYQEDERDGVKKLLNDLFTAQVNYAVVVEESSDIHSAIQELAPQIKDQLVNVSAYKSSNGKQAVKIVTEFKLSKPSSDSEKTEVQW